MKTSDNKPAMNAPSDAQSIDDLFAELGRTKESLFSTTPVPTQHVDLPHDNLPRPASTSNPAPQPVSRHAAIRSRRESGDFVDSLLRFAMVGCFLFAGFFLLKAIPGSPLRSRPASASATNKPVIQRQLITRDIAVFDVGMRAMGTNPLREQVDPNLPEPDPKNCRKLVLRMSKDSGRLLLVKLLRELQWIEANQVVEGGTFFLNLPEMGAVGDAFVEALLPCPPIEKGPGNVVTGTFAHEADPETKILSVTFANGAYIKGVTDNHPFYSVDRHDFIPVGEMREGDFVKFNDGVTRITKLESRFARPGEMLYNLETHNEHVYQVTTAGILVHNTCAGFNPKMREAHDWLKTRGFDSSKATPYVSKFSARYGGDKLNGMRHGNIGYRIEFDAPNKAHINVFSGKDIGPHFTFSQNEADMAAVLRQLFGN
jgi:hypothetical protein